MPFVVILAMFAAAALIGLVVAAGRARPGPRPASRVSDDGYFPLFGDGGSSTSTADCVDSGSDGSCDGGGGDGGGGGGD